MLCVFASSFHPSTWEPARKTFSLSSILFIHLKEKPMVGIFFISNSKIKENENKTKNLSLWRDFKILKKFPQFCDTKILENFSQKRKKNQKNPKLVKLALENNIFQKKKSLIFGFKRRQDLSWKTTGPCLHPMVEN